MSNKETINRLVAAGLALGGGMVISSCDGEQPPQRENPPQENVVPVSLQEEATLTFSPTPLPLPTETPKLPTETPVPPTPTVTRTLEPTVPPTKDNRPERTPTPDPGPGLSRPEITPIESLSTFPSMTENNIETNPELYPKVNWGEHELDNGDREVNGLFEFMGGIDNNHDIQFISILGGSGRLGEKNVVLPTGSFPTEFVVKRLDKEDYLLARYEADQAKEVYTVISMLYQMGDPIPFTIRDNPEAKKVTVYIFRLTGQNW